VLEQQRKILGLQDKSTAELEALVREQDKLLKERAQQKEQ
jgi:hypothetical protein